MNDVPLSAYLEPQWLIPLLALMIPAAFAALWLGVGAALAYLGGWASLARRFRAAQPASGERFRAVSGFLGARLLRANYRRCLTVAVGDGGIHLAVPVLLRFQSPPLFIPWAEVESVEEKHVFLSRYAVIRVRGQRPAISLQGRAGQCVKEAFARNSAM